MFNEVEELGVLTKEGHAKLISITSDLLRHLWDEDELLFPVLRRAAVHNKKLKETLGFFTNGLGSLHEDALKFFTNYSTGIIKSDFQKKYERLFDAISRRIGYEENILFDEYENIVK